MTEDSTHIGPNEGDPADRGGEVGVGLEPDEVVEGRAEAMAAGEQTDGGQASAAAGQPDEGLLEPGGVEGER